MKKFLKIFTLVSVALSVVVIALFGFAYKSMDSTPSELKEQLVVIDKVFSDEELTQQDKEVLDPIFDSMNKVFAKWDQEENAKRNQVWLDKNMSYYIWVDFGSGFVIKYGTNNHNDLQDQYDTWVSWCVAKGYPIKATRGFNDRVALIQ